MCGTLVQGVAIPLKPDEPALQSQSTDSKLSQTPHMVRLRRLGSFSMHMEHATVRSPCCGAIPAAGKDIKERALDSAREAVTLAQTDSSLACQTDERSRVTSRQIATV